jgi:hypothetical protein
MSRKNLFPAPLRDAGVVTLGCTPGLRHRVKGVGGAIVRREGGSRRCRWRGGAREEPWPESNTQGAEEEEQHVPKYDANSLPDRRDGGENLGFRDGESLPPGLSTP